MRAEVVHHHHVARRQLRAKDLIEVGEKYLSICGLGDGHGGDHAARAHGADDGENLPVALWRGF